MAKSPNSTLPAGIFSYLEKVGDTVVPFAWQAEKTTEGIVIKVEEEGKTFFNLCRPDGSTLKWQFRAEGKHDIIAERIDNTIAIQGTRFGEPIADTVQIDDRPWYQPLSFSLGNFLTSTEEKTSFWVIRADKIDVVALTAEKVGEETLLVGEKEFLTHKIEVRAEGFYAKLWHATYWYRKSDNLFIRYQSVHGLPGTDATIVEILPASSSSNDT
ncbi:MAG: hypothetical protein V2I36_12870 [Desulfopila sp.]|nr:hypothetical protein [Desulfopila sp.]